MTRRLDDFGALMRAVRTLGRARCARKRAGRLEARIILVTDPDRLPDPFAAVRRLPRGSLVIHRTFGRPEGEVVARTLVSLARRRGHRLLIGADEALARRVRAHGLHLPERDLARAARVKARNPGWLVTGAAHDRAAIARAAGVDAILVSPLFASRSAPARRPLGVTKLALLARAARAPVYALGGINARTARRLTGLDIAGIAAVEAFRT